jgi:hypothetical protein
MQSQRATIDREVSHFIHCDKRQSTPRQADSFCASPDFDRLAVLDIAGESRMMKTSSVYFQMPRRTKTSHHQPLPSLAILQVFADGESSMQFSRATIASAPSGLPEFQQVKAEKWKRSRDRHAAKGERTGNLPEIEDSNAGLFDDE